MAGLFERLVLPCQRERLPQPADAGFARTVERWVPPCHRERLPQPADAGFARTVERWVLPQPPIEIATASFGSLAMTIRKKRLRKDTSMTVRMQWQ